MGQRDQAFLFGALGLGMSGAVGVGAVVELADQLDGPVEGIEASLAMVTDMHHAAAGGAIAIENIEIPGGEIEILGPGESHRVALQVLMKSSDRRIRTRGYARRLAFSSHLSGRDLFWGRPTLVGIEPASMTAVFCRNTADRKAATWDETTGAVHPPGVRRLRRRQGDRKGGGAAGRGPARRPLGPAAGARPGRLPHRRWKPTGCWPGTGDAPRRPGRRPRPADAKVAAAKRQGIDARGPARTAGAAWRRATAAFEEAERLESAWGRAARCAGVVRCRRPAQRPHPGRSRDRRGAEGSRPAPTGRRSATSSPTRGAWPSWTGCIVGWSRPSRGRSGGRRWPGGGGCGTAGSARRTRSRSCSARWRGAASWTRRSGRQLRAGGGGAGGHGAGQQRGGVHEQRAADAAVAAPADDAADAGPQAAVLELPAVPLRAAEGRLPLPGVGPGVAHVRLLGVAPRRPGPVDATTVNSRKCRLRQVKPRLTRLSISAQQDQCPPSLGSGWFSRLRVGDESFSSGCKDWGARRCRPLSGRPVHSVPSSSPPRGSTARTARCPPAPGLRLPRTARSTTSAISGD